jgi:hypothetical protein
LPRLAAQLRERLDSVAAVDSHVAFREPGEDHVVARKQLRDDVREQQVAQVVAIEGVEHHDRIMFSGILHYDSRPDLLGTTCAPFVMKDKSRRDEGQVCSGPPRYTKQTRLILHATVLP